MAWRCTSGGLVPVGLRGSGPPGDARHGTSPRGCRPVGRRTPAQRTSPDGQGHPSGQSVNAPTGPSTLTGVPGRGEPDPDERAGQPSADGRAEYSPAQDEAVPAEWAGRDDAAAPYAVADSGPDDGWYEDPQPTSVHQIPQRWSWQPEPLRLQTRPDPPAGRAQGRRARPASAQAATGTSRATKPGRTRRHTSRSAPGRGRRRGRTSRPASRGARRSGSRGRTGRRRGNRGSFLWSARRRRCAAGPGDQGLSCHRGRCPGSTTRRGGPGGSSRRACGTSRESAGSRPWRRRCRDPAGASTGAAGDRTVSPWRPMTTARTTSRRAAAPASRERRPSPPRPPSRARPTSPERPPSPTRPRRRGPALLRCPVSGGTTSPATAPVSRTSCTGPGRARSARRPGRRGRG